MPGEEDGPGPAGLLPQQEAAAGLRAGPVGACAGGALGTRRVKFAQARLGQTGAWPAPVERDGDLGAAPEAHRYAVLGNRPAAKRPAGGKVPDDGRLPAVAHRDSRLPAGIDIGANPRVDVETLAQ